jgi:exopolysaccharide biosynthesis protein/transposase
MNSVTQDMKFRQSLMIYAQKYGVSRASRKYNKSRSFIYFWMARYDGTLESLACRSRRPHSHPNQHTPAELKLIRDMRRRNPDLGIIELWSRLKKRGYTRCPESLFRVMRRMGMFPESKPKKKYQPKPYEQMTYPGERIQIDVKVVPKRCITDPELRLFQYTAIDEFSRLRFLAANSYQSKDLSITVTPYQLGSGTNKITYYVADVYTSNINCFRTYFGQNTYGTGYTEHLTNMSRDVHSVLAMNGDSYCYNRQHTAGVLIRNGTLYRAEPTTSDVCILYKNGEMKTYSPDQFDLQQAMQDGAYQSWTFGPNLLDSQGKALKSFNTWDYIRKAHPRSAIGYYEPGHYCFVVVDGRQTGYSRGMTLPELAQVFENLGCSAAYNLDGGHSTFMTMGDQVVNQPYKSSHEIVDCLYFGEVQ